MPDYTAPPQNARVLIVDDEPRIRELLLDLCPDLGLVPAAARSAEEAIRMVEQSPPDILVLDLNLPQMPGLDLLEHLRTTHPQTPAIILTGFGDLAAARRAIHLNVTEFLTKPCHLRDLELALDRARRALPPRRAAPTDPAPPSDDGDTMTLAESEYRQILGALRRNAGNRTAAAQQLGISRRTLHYRLTHYKSLGYPVE
jgi:two-component system response regulator (stage 0 sporulation protein F)